MLPFAWATYVVPEAGPGGGATPSLLTFFLDIVGCTLVVEPLFFYAHWLLHHPKLYGAWVQLV